MIYNMSHVIGRAHAKQAAVLIRVCIGVHGSLNTEVAFLENAGVGLEMTRGGGGGVGAQTGPLFCV